MNGYKWYELFYLVFRLIKSHALVLMDTVCVFCNKKEPNKSTKFRTLCLVLLLNAFFAPSRNKVVVPSHAMVLLPHPSHQRIVTQCKLDLL